MRRMSTPLALAGVSLACLLILSACSSAPILRYVTVSPTSATIDAGTQQQFTATAYYSDGTYKDATSLVTWSSSNMAVATIANGGLATGVGPGSTTITATAAGTPGATATLNVLQLQSIAISTPNTNIAAGATAQFTATGTFNNGSGTPVTQDITNQVTWNSSNQAAATIDSTGLATGVAAGQTSITASLLGVNSNSVTLTVGAAVPVSLVITPATQTIAVGNAFTFSVQEQYSDSTLHPPAGTVTWSSSSTASAGIVPAPAGSANAIAAGFAPSGASGVTITATEGSLTAGTATLTVVAGTAKYAYVANNGGGTPGADNIEWYAVDVTSSTPLTSPNTVTANAPAQVLLHPSNLYLYTVDAATNVYLFTVNGTTGALTNTGFGPAAAGQGNSNYALTDPYGRFLYVVDAGCTTCAHPLGTIYGFTISPTDGTLAAISAVSAYTTNVNAPESAVIDQTGTYLYVGNLSGNNVSAYSIDQTTGALTALSPTATFATGTGPQWLGLDPSGTHLYVANSTANTVSVFPFAAGGALGTATTESSFTPAPTTLTNLVVDPSGTHIYVLDSGTATNGQVYGFNLNADGTFGSAISGTPIATGNFPFFNIAVDPPGALLATPNNLDGPPGTVSLFKIGAGGALTADTAATAGNAPTFVIFYNSP